MMTLLLCTIARSSSNHDHPPSSLKVMISVAALVRSADGCEEDLKDAVRISGMSSASILRFLRIPFIDHFFSLSQFRIEAESYGVLHRFAPPARDKTFGEHRTLSFALHSPK